MAISHIMLPVKCLQFKKIGDVSIEYNSGDKLRIINTKTKINGTYQFELRYTPLKRNKSAYKYWSRLNDKSSHMYNIVFNIWIKEISDANSLTNKFKLEKNKYPDDFPHPDKLAQKCMKICQKNQVASKIPTFGLQQCEKTFYYQELCPWSVG